MPKDSYFTGALRGKPVRTEADPGEAKGKNRPLRILFQSGGVIGTLNTYFRLTSPIFMNNATLTGG
ncbi:MAG: hypothetical protein JWP00_4111 [Chloroflexi bacterium]|nr:hypothetical protein [Chloroflexota bacterium]